MNEVPVPLLFCGLIWLENLYQFMNPFFISFCLRVNINLMNEGCREFPWSATIISRLFFLIRDAKVIFFFSF